MPQALFIVRLADLERGKRQYEWELPLSWLRGAFEATEASVESPGSLVLEASLTSSEVLIRGEAAVKVTMPCARTLDPVPVDLSAEISLALRPATTANETNVVPSGSATKKSSRTTLVSKTAPAAKPRSAKRPDASIPADEAEEDVYHGDQVELDEFIREFLLLELPMMPLRSDLRSEERPAIHPTPGSPAGGESSHAVDPRLRPLATIASRLSKKTKE